MIKIYHLDKSRSERIVWLMEELELPYELEIFERERSGSAPEAMQHLFPLGKAPIIVDGETVLAESGAIVEYILNRHAGGRLGVAPGAENYAQYLYWLHFAEGSLMAAKVLELVMARAVPDHPALAGTRASIGRMHALVEDRLGEAPYFAGGEFTAADIMMLFPFTSLAAFTGEAFSAYPHLTAYLRRIAERPAYARAMELAGPNRKRT